MKIHMIVPPYCIGEDGKAIIPNKAMLPVGPLMVATLLSQQGCQVTVTDLVFRTDWKNYLPLEQPDVLLLSCHTLRNITVCTAVLDELRARWNGLPHIVIGGNICNRFGVREFAKRGLQVDAVVRGWGHTPDAIEKIVNKQHGDIRAGYWAELPQPSLNLLTEEVHGKYRDASEGKYPMYAFGTGCLWACAYCESYMGSKWVKRNQESALAEVNVAYDLGYRKIWAVDNLAFRNPETALAFDEALDEKGMNWSGMTRAELVRKIPDEYFRRFQALTEVAMGVETASKSQLKVLNRGIKQDNEQTLKMAFRKLNQAGVTTNAFAILDLPGSTEADFWALYRLLERVETGTVSWSFYNPPPEVAKTETAGFYRWPLGHSIILPRRVVQEAMVLTGRWWLNFHLWEDCPFFEDNDVFGANFLEAQIIQDTSARSPIGDLWDVWEGAKEEEA